jgi:hypothetical protein
MKAWERPQYLVPKLEQKFWEIQIEEVNNGGDRNVYFHVFDCSKKAAIFAAKNRVSFYPEKFYYSTVEKEIKRRATKHFK